MNKYFDGELLSAYEDLNSELECKKENLKLHQQIADLKAENESLKKYETIYYLNQLQASNKDIDKFKQNQIQQSINISDLLKDNTKRVCEKIRKFVDDYTKQHAGYYYDPDVNAQDLYDFLDQIEKGENDEKTTYK